MTGLRLAPALVALLAALPAVLAYIPPGTPSYTDLAPFNGQWNITLAKSLDTTVEGGGWKAHTCNASTYGAACNQPVMVEHSNAAVKIMFTRRNLTRPFTTWKNGTPVDVVLRLNYMPVSQVDRGWRKKNQAYPSWGMHNKWTITVVPFAESGEGVWQMGSHAADEVTDAVLYPEVCVRCQMADGDIEYCQCDRRNTNTTTLTVETAVEGSITPAMRASAIALSVIGPLFLVIYVIADNLYYKKHNKSLQWARI